MELTDLIIDKEPEIVIWKCENCSNLTSGDEIEGLKCEWCKHECRRP